MYEQVVYNTLSLAGLARPSTPAMRYNGQYESIVLVSEADIQVPLEECLDGTCTHCEDKKVGEGFCSTYCMHRLQICFTLKGQPSVSFS